MKRIFYVFLFLPVLVFAQSAGFVETTFNTLIDKTYFKNLYQNPTGNPSWTLDGNGMLQVGNYYYLSDGSSLFSSEFDGKDFTALNIVLNARSYNGNSVNNKYIVGIEYEDGEIVEDTLLTSSNQYNLFPFRFNDIKPEKFRIRIKSHMKSVASCIAVDYVYVKCIRTAPQLLFESSNTGFTVSACMDYDECIMELYRQEYLESGIDTLYFNDFSSDDLSGMEVNTDYIISNGSLYIISKKQDIKAVIPFFPNRNIDKVNLKCVFGVYSKNNHNVNIYYNDDLIVEKKISGTSGDFIGFSYDMNVGQTSLDSLKFIVKAYENSTANLVLDNVLLSQKCEYQYKLLPGFPKRLQFPLSVEDLDCTSSYRVRYQLIDNENEKGERVVTALGEGYFNTTGEFKQLPPDSEFTLESDFEGTIMVSNRSNLYGNHTVLGELCYVHEYSPGEWASVALPFKPQRIGAFIGGEGYYLRPNSDFYLRSYSENEEKFLFLDSEAFEPYKGYILKVPESMNFDNNALFIYSPRRTTVNEPYSYNLEKLYSHVANPYVYSLNYKDNGAEIERLFQGNIIYKFDGTSFKVLSSDESILPFESVIVYSGGVNSAPRIISLENEPSGIHENDSAIGIIVSVFDNGIEIYGYSGYVEIYGGDGNSVVRTSYTDGKRITIDNRGVYIVRIGNNTKKIIL